MTAARTTMQLVADTVLLLEALTACETDEEAIALLDEQLAIEAEIEAKLERLHAVQRRAETEAGLLRDEERRLAARRARCERTVARVKELAQAALEAHREMTGSAKVVTGTLTARLQLGARKLNYPSNADKWPSKYIVQRPELDRQRLKADLQRGIEVEGCSLTQSEHVRWA